MKSDPQMKGWPRGAKSRWCKTGGTISGSWETLGLVIAQGGVGSAFPEGES